MELDVWRVDDVAAAKGPDMWEEEHVAATKGPGRSWRKAALSGSGATTRPVAVRSECWEALRTQQAAAESTGSFVFSDRRLDGLAVMALPQYLRDECRSKFVDLSRLGRFGQASGALAEALQHGLRATRQLTLDGNDLGADLERLQAWCVAISEHPGLQHLSMRDVGLDDTGVQVVAAVLKDSAVLFSVDLASNRFGDAGAQALAHALADNRVLIELNLEDTDVSDAGRYHLASITERNSARFRSQGGGVRALQHLRRARAEALTALPQLSVSVQQVSSPSHQSSPLAPALPPALRGPSELDRNALGYDFNGPDDGHDDGCSWQEQADGVFFDAGNEALLQELLQRCEAGWRYTAADREVLVDFRKRIADLKACRRNEFERAEEIIARVVEAQKAFQLKAVPVEEAIISKKEELATEIEATKNILQESIRLKLARQAAQDELKLAEEETGLVALKSEKLRSSLQLRHREVDEEVQAQQQEVGEAEQRIEELEADNERCRRLLHACRFETETERFVPHATLRALEERAAAEAAIIRSS